MRSERPPPSPPSRHKFQLILVLLFQPTGRIAFTLFIMPREFHKMPALPDTIDDPKVQELMSHYFATSNHDSDHEGFVEMFTADGEYSMNDRKAKGRQGSTIPTFLPIRSESCAIPHHHPSTPDPRPLHACWQSNIPYTPGQHPQVRSLRRMVTDTCPHL